MKQGLLHHGAVTPFRCAGTSHPLYEQLLTLDFLGRGENILLRGQAGVGKTTLAQNLGLRALERGHTVRFSTLPGALADLLRQESLPATEQRLRRYTFPDLLILDELGYVPCDSLAGGSARAPLVTALLLFLQFPFPLVEPPLFCLSLPLALGLSCFLSLLEIRDTPRE